MNALVKLVVFFAVLGIFGAGLFFFPQSPVHYTKIRTIIVEREVPAEVQEEKVSETAPAVTNEQITNNIPEVMSEEVETQQVPALNE